MNKLATLLSILVTFVILAILLYQLHAVCPACQRKYKAGKHYVGNVLARWSLELTST